MYRAVLITLCLAVATVSSGSSYTDSLRAVASRLSGRIISLGHESVAVIGVGDVPTRTLTNELVGELTYQLANQSTGFNLVERSQLDVLLRELHLSASGITSNVDALQLGELACATTIITVQVQAVDKRRVQLEIKLLNTASGLLEGMERSVVPIPPMFKGGQLEYAPESSQPAANEQASAWDLHLAGGLGDSYGAIHPFVQVDALARGGRFASGLRVRLMPDASNGLPHLVQFGRLSTSASEDLFGIPQPYMDILSGGGEEVHLVRANDPSYGAGAVLEAMANGANTAQWDQIEPINFHASRWSVMVPLRLYWGPLRDPRKPAFHTEIAFGADLYTIQASYAVTSLSAQRVNGSASFTVDEYTTNGPFNDRMSNTALFWHASFGMGVEWNRFGLSLGGQRSLHRAVTNMVEDPFMTSSSNASKVQGDPIAIALLNGTALDQVPISGAGSVPFGTIDASDMDKRFSSMERFLDRWQWNATVSIRLF